MPFLHIFCKKSQFALEKVHYIVTCEPEIEEDISKTVNEIFHQFCDGSGAAMSGSQSMSLACRSDKLPVNVAEKSLVVLVLLQRFEELGWALVAGENIHDERGMIFKKVKRN